MDTPEISGDRRPQFSLTLRSAADMEAALKLHFDVDVSEFTREYGGQIREIFEIYMAATFFAGDHGLQPIKVGWIRRMLPEDLIVRAMVPEDQHKRLRKLTMMMGSQLAGG